MSDALSVAEVEITPIVAIALAASLLNAGIAVGSTAVVGAGVRGEGLNRLSYAGRWDFVHGNFDGRLDGQSARSFHPDDDVTLFFNGRRLRIFGITGPTGGTASVSLGDGSAEQTISFYADKKHAHALIYSSGLMTPGSGSPGSSFYRRAHRDGRKSTSMNSKFQRTANERVFLRLSTSDLTR